MKISSRFLTRTDPQQFPNRCVLPHPVAFSALNVHPLQGDDLGELALVQTFFTRPDELPERLLPAPPNPGRPRLASIQIGSSAAS
jgi:hypothetical protein